MFLNTNKNTPLLAKRKVVEAGFNAVILYGCGSLSDTSLHIMDKLHTSAVKCLLGVRLPTANDLFG